jgi:hypothetical protein
MTSRELPPYVNRNDGLVLVTPVCVEQATLYFFPVPTDPNNGLGLIKQQNECERILNRPSNGACDYRAFCPNVWLSFRHYGKVLPPSQDWLKHHPDGDQVPMDWPLDHGYVSYRACDISIPIKSLDIDGSRLDGIFAFPYSGFIDEQAAFTGSRELQGSNIETAKINDFKLEPEILNELSVEPVVLRNFSPNTLAKHFELIHITKVPGAQLGSESPRWTSEQGMESFRQLARLIQDQTKCPFPIDGRVNLAFLKQFPDAQHPRRACYQAGVEQSVTVSRWRTLGQLPGSYRLSISDVDSHPLVDELGLDPSQFSSLPGFYAQLDFIQHRGMELWPALSPPSKAQIAARGSYSRMRPNR